MGWLLLIFLLYFLCLSVEQALVNISPYDLDLLRAEDSRAARNALSISLEIRSTLAALLFARVMLILFAGVWVVANMFYSGTVSTWILYVIQQQTLPAWLIWALSGIFSILLLSLLFWSLQKINLHFKQEGKAARHLKRMWWFVYCWKILFLLFTQKERKEEALEEKKAEAPARGSEKRELELLKSIVQFGDVTVKQVMQPRSKVVFVDFRTNFHQLLEVVRQSEFSRMPICDEDLDNITGMLYVKDLLPYLDREEAFEWQSLIRTNVMMVPEAKRGSELLEEFKQQRMHMAMVVDEYGGVAGIVTMEDILEEVTGDIRDEFDEESEIRYRKMDDFNYIFEGQTLLNDVCRICGLPAGTFDPVRATSDTLAGLALELRGDIPVTGAEIPWNGFLLTVTHANRRKIEQLKLTLPRGGAS